MNHPLRVGTACLLATAFAAAHAAATFQPHLDSTGGNSQVHGSLLSPQGTRHERNEDDATNDGFQDYADSTGGTSAAAGDLLRHAAAPATGRLAGRATTHMAANLPCGAGASGPPRRN
jgi:hypothetical protein